MTQEMPELPEIVYCRALRSGNRKQISGVREDSILIDQYKNTRMAYTPYILKSEYTKLEEENKELKKIKAYIKDDDCFDMKSYEIAELKVQYAGKCEENARLREALQDIIDHSKGSKELDEICLEALKGNEDGK